MRFCERCLCKMIFRRSDISGRISHSAIIAQKIADGHAYSKHGAEFGASDSVQFSRIIESIIRNPSDFRQLSRGRIVYWDDRQSAIVITDPNHVDGGTIFKPARGKSYFYSMR